MSLSNDYFGNKNLTLSAFIPSKQLMDQSLQFVAPRKLFKEWTVQNHADSYFMMHRMAKLWENCQFTQQYLIYGNCGSAPFTWEIVPYQKCRHFVGRIVQQLQVLWRTIFGGIIVSTESREKQVKKYEQLLCHPFAPMTSLEETIKGSDSFCKEETIERQWVITGEKVNVLFNYAPIGFGGERLHFLVVPKAHRETFTDVTQDEYVESLELTTKLVNHFSETRQSIKNVYLLNKTGVDAGQTVKHWHLHVIFSTNVGQDFWGKLTVLKNILLGSSPMNKEELAKKVSALREEFAQNN